MASVDVIIPCYRYGQFLRHCVESVLSHSTVDLRILIIDDASPDNTSEVAAELVTKDTRVSFRRHTANKGHISTYNEGIDWASADFLLLLSADDYLLPGALNRSVDLMTKHPEVGFSFGKAVDVRGDKVSKDNVVSTAVDTLAEANSSCILSGEKFFLLIERMKSLNIVPTPTAVVRTKLQKQLGGYRHELPHAGDLEMWLRFASRAPVGVIADYQAACRFHGNNMHVSYGRNKQLPDLEQRKAAINCVLANANSVLPNREELRRRLLKPIAQQALDCAGWAFNDCEVDLMNRLCVFANQTYPNVKRTREWLLLKLKQHLGVKFWLSIRPTLHRLRDRIRWAFGERRSLCRY